ncbi:GDSL-type esterase/lipase family protein [Streptomyces sp. NPDC088794]|uniref:SGNH/GDSL hydrolase family protein n=1 Tax=Streptomyces sp. NPDC088794 TaxID=3365902 RepID=UPI00380A16E4
MRRRSLGRRITAAAVVLLGLVTAAGPASAQATGYVERTRAEEPLPLEQLFDNTAVSDDALPGQADFDGSGASLSARDLTAAGWTPGRTLTVQGADLTWPDRQPGEPDNATAAGQSVLLTGTGDALAFLATATGGRAATGSGTVSYADGSSSAYRLTAPDWRTGALATKAVTLPHVNTPAGQLTSQARLYVVTVPITPGREVVSVRLPSAAGLHVFALSVRAKSAGWTGSWTASTSGYPAVGPWTDRTLRLVVHTSVGGPRVRLRFDNTFAAAPVRIGGATVAVQSAGATARDVPVALSFGGAAGVEVPAGAQAFTDPLGFEVPADTNLLVSFHLPDTVATVAEHRLAKQRSYLSTPGDHTADSASTAYTTTLTTWPLLTGVVVSGGPGSVVLLGDSITDGAGSTTDSNRRWPNALATRLLAQNAVPRYGVLNQGISGNRVVAEIYHGEGISTDSTGVDALNRLDRDVLAQTSVRTVIVFEGVNDVRWQATAAQVVAGLREIAERGHERGLRMLVATILPCAGEVRCTAAVDTQRVAVNTWIRANDVFDGVVDFDAVLRDPAQPARLLPAYDGGDHLHPGETGLAALAGAVDLTLL